MKPEIRFFSILLIFFIIQDATSQQITYSGPVQYKFIRTKTANGGGSEGYNWNVHIDEKYIIEGTFYVTFTGGVSPSGVAMYQLTSIEEDIHFENRVNNEANEEMISRTCFDDRMKFTRTETPGDSRTERLAVKSETLDPEKPCVFSGNLTIMSPASYNKKEPTEGKYSIMLMGEIKADVTSKKYEERTFPCLDTIIPPHSFTSTSKMNIPIAIVAEKTFDGSNILEGSFVVTDNHNTDCRGVLGSLARMAHGDVNCAYDENVTVSWTLVKRTKECDANLSKANGDVKINGVPAKEGNIKIGAGDMISTGDKSRMQINMPGGNETIMLGSNSNFIVKDPCNLAPPKEMGDPHKKGYRLLQGKIMCVLREILYDGTLDFELNVRYAGAGVRGQISPAIKKYYCSNNDIKLHGGPYFELKEYIAETDPEKESMIKEFGDLSAYKAAFYVHTEREATYDVSVIKGDILVESAIESDKMVVKEGSTVTSWPDGSPFIDIYISAK